MLERLVEARQRLLVAVHGVEHEAVIQKHLRRLRPQLHRRRNEPQRRRKVAARQLDDAEHLQRVEMIGPHRQHRGVEPLGLRDPPLMVQLQRLMHGARNVEWLALRQRRQRHGSPGLERSVAAGAAAGVLPDLLRLP